MPPCFPGAPEREQRRPDQRRSRRAKAGRELGAKSQGEQYALERTRTEREERELKRVPEVL